MGTSIPREFSSAPRAHKNSTTRNKMAFSMTSALSSRVSATTSSLRTQRVQKRQSASFKCNAYDEAEIDKRYPQGGSVYKVTLDCSVSNISLGLLLKPGEDGRPVVRTVRPGGKALGPVLGFSAAWVVRYRGGVLRSGECGDDDKHKQDKHDFGFGLQAGKRTEGCDIDQQ